jgi:diphosphomevalonate decarboxylase
MIKEPFSGEKVIRWQSPSNIALIKYWGKTGNQIPSSPSISMTLSRSVSVVGIRYRVSGSRKGMGIGFEFEGERNEKFEQRIQNYLGSLVSLMPFLDQLEMKIESRNTFPHSAGIASSASGFSALALCLCSMEQDLFGTLSDPGQFFRKASYLARLGSGSAARSVYGGFVTWGKAKALGASADEYAQPLTIPVHPVYNGLRDTILIVSSKEKSLSSSQGHVLMKDHPYARDRFAQADENYQALLRCLESGDIMDFLDIAEHEALSLHALMMSSRPGYTLMHPNTIPVLERVREFRKQTGIPVGFTLDAGPNVHLLFPQEREQHVSRFVRERLKERCENGQIIEDQIGSGPVQLV